MNRQLLFLKYVKFNKVPEEITLKPYLKNNLLKFKFY